MINSFLFSGKEIWLTVLGEWQRMWLSKTVNTPELNMLLTVKRLLASLEHMQPTAQLFPQPILQKTVPQTKPKELIITKRYEEILQKIHTLRFVTAWDITRLFFAETSINHAREILSLLAGKADYAQRHYLYRFPLPNTRIGNTEKIYTLGSKGRAYLQSLGMQVDWYFRPYKYHFTEDAMTYYQTSLHALTLTHFLVAAEVFCKKQPSWHLPKMHTEYALKKDIEAQRAKIMVAVTTKDGKAHEEVSAIPDAWLDFHNPSSTTPWQPVLLEIDRVTEQQHKFKKHVKARIQFFSSGGYHKLFGTNKGVIAYATIGNQTRVQTMLAWTQEVLEELDMRTYGSRFRFCRLLPSWEQDERKLFLSSLWYRPYDKKPVPLLC